MNTTTETTLPTSESTSLSTQADNAHLQPRSLSGASFTYDSMNIKFLFLLANMQLVRKNAKRLMGKRAPERVKRGQLKRQRLGRVPYFPLSV